MRHLIIIFVSLMLITSCVDSLDDYNIDQKRPSTAPAETFLTASVKLLIRCDNDAQCEYQ